VGQIISQAANDPDDGIINLKFDFVGIERAFWQHGSHLLCCQYMLAARMLTGAEKQRWKVRGGK